MNEAEKRMKGAARVAVVTGGAQGIGRAVASRLGAEKAHVVLLDRSPSHLSTAMAALKDEGVEATSFPLDVTNRADVNAAFKSVIEKFGKIDVVVSAAGITGKTNVRTHEVDFADFQSVMNVNMYGIMHCTQAVLPSMLKQRFGRIVNIASIAGKDGNAGMLAYSASKAAVIGFTKVVGKEYAKDGITCNAVAPATIRTPMVAALPEATIKYMLDKIPMGRTGELDEIAALVAYIASPEASFTTGFCFDCTGGRATY